MNNLLNDSVLWFALGLAFFLLEFVFPGFILFFFGIGAWIVAIASMFLSISVNVQLLLFLASSILSVLLFRNWVKHKLGMNSNKAEVLEDEIIGKTARAETPIAPGENGRVEFKGAIWDAYSEDNISAGEQVLITGNQSILLIVKSIKSI